ncbi:MAG: OsmC family protein [Candidatus Aminicenantales bacterium]
MKEMTVTFPGGKRVEAAYKDFVIKTDQPVYAGGEGTAPAPFDLFLASIGACAGFYLLSFCQSRGIPTEEGSVVMRTHKDPERKMIDRITIELNLPPGFPEKYHKAVIKAVDSCPVKAHILTPPAFEIHIV